jgi:hypothetical protein
VLLSVGSMPPLPGTTTVEATAQQLSQRYAPFLFFKKKKDEQLKNKKRKKREYHTGNNSDSSDDEEDVDDEDVAALDSDENGMINAFISFNKDLAKREHCVERVHRTNSSGKACNCLQILNLRPEFCPAIAEYQIYFANLKREEQQKIAIDWMRSCEAVRYNKPKNSPLYPVPFHRPTAPANITDDQSLLFQPLKDTKICRDALMDLLGVGRSWWTSVNKHCKNNTQPLHKLKGKISNSKRKWNEMHSSHLVQHFEDLRKEASSIVPQCIRERIGEGTTSEGDDKDEYLPASYSMRKCYYKYCRSRGVKVTSNARGDFLMTKMTSNGAEEDDDSSSSTADFDVTHPSVPSWGSYRAFWAKEYANLKLSRPTKLQSKASLLKFLRELSNSKLPFRIVVVGNGVIFESTILLGPMNLSQSPSTGLELVTFVSDDASFEFNLMVEKVKLVIVEKGILVAGKHTRSIRFLDGDEPAKAICSLVLAEDSECAGKWFGNLYSKYAPELKIA